jgi:hypothetical protein
MTYFLLQNNNKIVIVLLLCFALTNGVWAQVALISSSDGGFENATATMAANGWTAVNTTATAWFAGTAGGSVAGGTRSAYVGSSTTYTGSTAAVIKHFYRDIAIPAGATQVYLNYYLKMPTIDNTFDYFYIYTNTTAQTPVSGTLPAGTQRIAYTTPALANFTAMPQIDLTALAGTTVRLVFTYKTDAASPYANPAVDNISLTYCAASTAPTAITGTTTICTGSTTLTSSGGTLGTDAVDVWYEGGCGVEAFSQPWTTQPYTTGNNATTFNSTNALLNVTSTSNDPWIHMPSLGSFNPNTYRYINVRFRVTSVTQVGGMQIFWYNTLYPSANAAQYKDQPITSVQNVWQTVSIDMLSPTAGNWLNSNVTGWRFDWATNNAVTMDIDFITLSDRPMIGSGPSITVSPTVNTTYFTAKKGACGLTACTSQTVTISCGSPTITAIPSSACVGTSITITGTNLSGTSSVTVNGVAATITSNTATTIIVTAPAGAVGTGNIVVTTPTGSASLGTITVNPVATAGTFQYANGSTQTICSGSTISCSNTVAPTNGGGASALSVVWYCGEELTPGSGNYGNWRESTLGGVSGTTSSTNLNTAAGGGTGMATSLTNYNPLSDFPSNTKFLIIRRGYNSNCGPCVGGCQDQSFYITVTTVPSITTNPISQSVLGGTNATFTAAASNSPTSYSWEVSTNSGGSWSSVTNGGVYSGATTASLLITGATFAMNGYQYRAKATNGCGTSIASSAATLTVTYCATSPTTVNGIDIITRVVLTNSIPASYTNNSTSNGTTNYDVYNNTPLDLYTGTTTNTLAITFGTDGTQASAAWIDFNGNGIYETSENIALSTSLAGSGATVTYSFTVPPGATLGITRMRVRGGADAVANYTAAGACTVSPFGETEDYLVNISSIPYRATYISMSTGSSNWCAGETRTVSVTITNSGTNSWTDGGGEDFNIGVKWNADADYFVRVDAQNLAPGATQTFNLTVTAPATPGTNNLTFNVVREGVAWFGGTYISPTININALPTSVNAGPDVAICNGANTQLSGSATAPTITLFSENFESCGNGLLNTTFCNWTEVLIGSTDSYSYWTIHNSCPISGTRSLTLYDDWDVAYCDYDEDGFLSSPDLDFIARTSSKINATSYTNLKLNFNWRCLGEWSGSSIFDYGMVVWSTDGITWNNVSNTKYYGQSTTQVVANLDLSAANGQQFYLGFRWINDGSVGGNPPFTIDDISITGTSPLTYAWSPVTGLNNPNIANPIATPTTTTTYTMTATANGCSATDQVIVTVNTLSVAASSVSGASTICNGGSATLTLSGGSLGTGATWQWYSGSCGGTPVGSGTSITVTPSATTTYFVRAEGTCNTTTCPSGATVTVVPIPTITSQPNSPAAICAGATSSNITVVATGGTPSLTYQWEYNNSGTWGAVSNGTPTGASYSGGTSPSMAVTLANASNPSSSHQYRCVIAASGSGCASVTSDVVTVTVYALPQITSSTSSLCEGATRTLQSDIAGVIWTASGCPTCITGGNIFTAPDPGGASANYTITASNNGCYGPASSYVQTVYDAVNADAGSNQTQCNNGTFTLAGNTPPAYPGIVAGWTLISGTATITTPSSPTSTVTGVPEGSSATLQWTIFNGSCTSSSTVILANNRAATANAGSNQAVCSGETITLSGSIGGSATTSTWSAPSGTFSNATSLTSTYTPSITSGTVTLTLTTDDPAGPCTAVVSTVVITVNESPSVTTSTTNVLCFGQTNGSATANVIGGTPAYTYTWNTSPTQTTQTASTLIAGIYTVIVTDQNTCSTTANATITAPAAILSASSVLANETCNQLDNGLIDVSVSGGTSPYTYIWSNGANTQDLNPLSAGTYVVTITDNNGCTTILSQTITQPSLLAATITPTNETCNELNNGTATVNVIGGSVPIAYLWSTSATTVSIGSLSAGSYSVTVTDNNGCTASATTLITQPDVLTINAPIVTNESCSAANNGSIAASVSGGTTAYTYTWSSGGGNVSTITNLDAGTYSLTVTDINSCATTVLGIVLGSSPTPSISVANSTSICAGGVANLVASVTNPDAANCGIQWQSSPDGLSWSNISGATGITYTSSALSTTTYYRAIYDCSTPCDATSNTVFITVNAVPSISVSGGTSVCVGGDATLTATPGGGANGCSIQWESSPNGTTWIPIPNANSTTYTTPVLSVTTYYHATYTCGGDGCTTATSATATVTVTPLPTIIIDGQ